ncbi:MAG: redoxin domain-containing protein [Pseudobacter sp.]|uniref:redoxin domain-containing protein n=1 Tax=Pseudobacter sp. TaxID=2045420 RepID=UPI003F7F1E59
MKTSFYLFCLAAIAGCGEAKQSQGFTIEGKINGVSSGLVRLNAYDEETRTTKVLDSVKMENGSFRFKGTVPAPEFVTINIEDYWGMSLFLENSDIKLDIDTTGSDHYDYTAYGDRKGAMLKNFKISGSVNQDQWDAFQNNPGLKQYDAQFKALNEAYSKATSKDEGYKIKEQIDSLRDLSMANRKKLVDSFVTANPASPAGAYMFYDYYRFNEAMPLNDMESLLAKYSGAAKNTFYFNHLTKELEKKRSLQPGKLAPDFTLLKPDSTQFTLSSLRGKYVMLDFWASWCVPCRKAIPHWKEVYKKYQPKGFEIVGVTNDSRWKDWFKALDEEKMPWLQVADEFPVKNMPSRVGTMFMTPYLPCYILLDKEGKIILHNPSKEQIDEKLRELLGA